MAAGGEEKKEEGFIVKMAWRVGPWQVVVVRGRVMGAGCPIV